MFRQLMGFQGLLVTKGLSHSLRAIRSSTHGLKQCQSCPPPEFRQEYPGHLTFS